MARIRFGIRSLAKTPVVSLVVLLSLGLGIGANTAVFSLMHQVLLSSLPVSHPEQLALLTSPGEFKFGRSSTNTAGGLDYIFSYRVFRALEKQPSGVAGLAGFDRVAANVAFGSQTLPGSMLLVSGGYFPLLGVQPVLGRTIVPADDTGPGNPVAILGYAYWQNRLNGNPEVLNQPIVVNGIPLTIIGIAPRDFNGTTLGDVPDIYVPISLRARISLLWNGAEWNGAERWDDYWVYLIARLQPPVSRARAEAVLNSVYSGQVDQQAVALRFRNPGQKERFLQSRLHLVEGKQGNSFERDHNRTALVILLLATGLILLIAIANAANLLLARSAERRRELAIRVALGAGRGEVMSQMLTEALLLSLTGGIVGVAIAPLSLKVLIAELAGDAPVFYLTAALDWKVLLFSLGLSLAVGILFGLYPAWEAARTSVAGTLKNEAGQASAARGAARVRRALVCAQVMTSAALVIPTGMFLKSLVNVLHVDLGLRTESAVEFSLAPRLNRYTPADAVALFDRVERELTALPGARSAAASMVPLISGDSSGTDIVVEGDTRHPNGHNSRLSEVSSGFFGKLGIPLIAGREFAGADTAGANHVAIVNEEFVKEFIGGDAQHAVGRRFTQDPKSRVFNIEIVGVVKNSHYADVRHEAPALFYTPWRQDPKISRLTFYVVSALPTGQMIQQIRRLMSSVDRNLPALELRTLNDTVRQNIRDDRLIFKLAIAFAGLATMLAILGLYGVMAHSVTRRTREIGIRVALGARPGRIRRLVMSELVWILGIGLAGGIYGGLSLARAVRLQLYEVKATDTTIVLAASLLLALTATLAAYLPARRAAKVNPLDALRYE